MLPQDARWVFNRKSKLWLPRYKKQTGFENKTRWDRLQLLIQVVGAIVLPISIIVGVLQFTAQQQHDLQISTDQQQQTTLETYLDRMSDLLLTHNLLQSKSGDPVRQVAEARTLTALMNLNSSRKGILVRFLFDSGLISYKTSKQPIIDLAFADLSGANLSNAILLSTEGSIAMAFANLDNANLTHTVLAGADLHDTELEGANLSFSSISDASLLDADLSNANFHDAFLFSTSMQNAIMDNTDLSNTYMVDANLSNSFMNGANLSGSNMSGANLSGADLSNADLRGATVSFQQLAKAKSLHGAIMPDGTTHP